MHRTSTIQMFIKQKYIYACVCKLSSPPPPDFDSFVDRRSSLPGTPVRPQPCVRLWGQQEAREACQDLGSWHVKFPLLLELSAFSRPRLSMGAVSGSSDHQETAGLNLRASQSVREHALNPKKTKGSWRFALP